MGRDWPFLKKSARHNWHQKAGTPSTPCSSTGDKWKRTTSHIDIAVCKYSISQIVNHNKYLLRLGPLFCFENCNSFNAFIELQIVLLFLHKCFSSCDGSFNEATTSCCIRSVAIQRSHQSHSKTPIQKQKSLAVVLWSTPDCT